MNKKRKPDNAPDEQYNDDYWLSMDIVSATDVTGMVPTPPLTDGQAEGYRDLLPIPQQKALSAQKADSPEEQEKHGRTP